LRQGGEDQRGQRDEEDEAQQEVPVRAIRHGAAPQQNTQSEIGEDRSELRENLQHGGTSSGAGQSRRMLKTSRGQGKPGAGLWRQASAGAAVGASPTGRISRIGTLPCRSRPCRRLFADLVIDAAAQGAWGGRQV